MKRVHYSQARKGTYVCIVRHRSVRLCTLCLVGELCPKRVVFVCMHQSAHHVCMYCIRSRLHDTRAESRCQRPPVRDTFTRPQTSMMVTTVFEVNEAEDTERLLLGVCCGGGTNEQDAVWRIFRFFRTQLGRIFRTQFWRNLNVYQIICVPLLFIHN